MFLAFVDNADTTTEYDLAPFQPSPLPYPLACVMQLTQHSFASGAVHLSTYLSERELRSHISKAEHAMAATQAGDNEAPVDRAQVSLGLASESPATHTSAARKHVTSIAFACKRSLLPFLADGL